jgi:cytochrome c oxidase subunit 4
MSAGNGQGQGHAHIAPVGMYVGIFLALMVLTVVTYLVTWVDLGIFNLAVAMAIAITKASLVILFFMHVWWSPKIIIMLMMVMTDYLSRPTRGLPPFPNAVATGTDSVGNDHPAKVLPKGEGEHH